MASSSKSLEAMFDDWISGLSDNLKVDLIKTLSVGERMLPSTSGWKSDGYEALI